MSASKIIKQILLEKDLKVSDLAKMLDIKPQILSNKLYRDTMSYAEFEKIINLLNYDISLIDKSTQ